MRKSRTDRNQKDIVRELRSLGYSVRHTHTIRKGFPDIVIGKHGFNLLVEIKVEGEDLTPDEKEFFQLWNGMVIVGTSAVQIHNDFMKTYGKYFI